MICRPRGDCEAFCTALGNCTAISIEPQPFGTSSRPGCTFFSDCTTSETVNHTTFARSAVLRKFKAPEQGFELVGSAVDTFGVYGVFVPGPGGSYVKPRTLA